MKLTEAPSELEASMICGYLRAHGVRATYDKGGVWQLPETPLEAVTGVSGASEAYVGHQEILIRREDAERALKLLAELPR